MSLEAVKLRRAAAGDLEALARIQDACPEMASWAVRDYLLYDCVLAEYGGRIAGFAAARRLAERENELLNVGVDPDFRRRGIGRRLIAELTESYPGTLWLEVRESNEAARNFYKVLGFEEAGRRPGYYRDPDEGAIVMKFHS